MRCRLLFVLFAALVISGCAIKPDLSQRCAFVRRDLAVADPQAASPSALVEQATTPGGSLAGDMLAALDAQALRTPVGQGNAMLFLSGGSLNGAYGAGFMDQWRIERGALPAFSVVTGISTGSILATFAFTGDTPAMIAGYTLSSERQILNPYVKPGTGGIGAAAGLTLIRKGALADLKPLRAQLDRALTDRVMTAVKRGADDGRKLYVGAVDVDRGEAVAFDMTEMASRWFAASEPDRTRFKSCYVEAILASSSAPIAAPPVFIDDRMYIDGGARFGVFSDELGRVLDERELMTGLTEAPPRTYVIINGTQQIADKTPPPGPHPSYTFLDLALRSEQILTNQVYRFSAATIESRARSQDDVFKFTRIGETAGTFSTALDGEPDGARTCSEWHAIDAKTQQPLQFFPLYMRCLIAYGRVQAHATLPDWDPVVR